MKKSKKVFLAEVVIDSKDPKLHDFGLGKGVLYSCEMTFTDDAGRGFKSPMFAAAIIREEDELLRKAVKVRWTEKKPKRKPTDADLHRAYMLKLENAEWHRADLCRRCGGSHAPNMPCRDGKVLFRR